jgi:hypothetical protein
MNQPKYNIGDTVFTLQSDGVIENVVYGIIFVNNELRYKLHDRKSVLPQKTTEYGWIQEERLFPTKEELIQSL